MEYTKDTAYSWSTDPFVVNNNLPAPIRHSRIARLETLVSKCVVVKGGLGMEEAGLCCGRQRWGWRWGVVNNLRVTTYRTS
jgi:hypothetical protein